MAERLGHSERSVRRIAAEILTKLGPEVLAILCVLGVVYHTYFAAEILTKLGPEVLAILCVLSVVYHTCFTYRFDFAHCTYSTSLLTCVGPRHPRGRDRHATPGGGGRRAHLRHLAAGTHSKFVS